MSTAMSRLLSRAERLDASVATQVGRKAYSSDTINDFYESNALNEPVKADHRTKIAAFFDGTFEKTGKNPRCFSMPGKHWKMEQLLVDRRQKKKQVKWTFVAAERQLAVLEYGMRYMPRFNQTAKFLPDSSLIVAATDRARIVNAPVIHLMDQIKRCPEAAHQFGAWSAFWWDMQGPLSFELAHMATRLQFCLCKSRERFPFAVTIMNGRDHVQSGDDDSLQARANLLAKQITNREFKAEILNCEKYNSANGTPMGLMFGMIKRV
jgi:hypothetical protein